MQFLGEQWVAAATAALAGLPTISGLDAVIEYTVKGPPVGRVSLTVTVSDGTVDDVTLGKTRSPDIAVSMDYPDAVAILSGESTSEAGYMSGAVRVEGDYPRWLLDLRPVRSAAIEALVPLMARTSR